MTAKHEPAAGGERTIWVAGWLLAAAILVFGAGGAAIDQAFSDPDHAMRLVRVRDLLAGQAWFDAVQHRLNPPSGVEMHWARWIDATIAAPIMMMTPVLGQQTAEVATAFLWPLALLALFMMLVVKVSGEIGASGGLKRETQWAAAVVAALAFPAIEEFAPGSFDHHGVELILGLAAVLGLMRMERTPRAAGWAGVALGAAMATAAEGAPMVAAGLLVAGALWLVRPEEFGRGLAWLGAGLSTSSLVLFVAMVPPSAWNAPVCDAMSTPSLGVGVGGGAIAMVLGAGLPLSFGSTRARRAATAAALGIAAALALAVLFPQCLGGAYSGLDANMQSLWLSQISESRPLLSLADSDFPLMMAVGGAALVGLIAAGFHLRAHWRDAAGWIVLAFLIVSWATLLWQIRAANFTTAFAIAPCAWAVAQARRNYRAKASAVRLAAFAGIAASSAAAAWAGAGGALQDGLTPRSMMTDYRARLSRSESCRGPEAFKPLAKAPKGTMLNQFALGADVLLWTDHAVLAAPYHRNSGGVMTTINALRSTPAAAQEIVARSAADYVLVCPGLPETGFYARHPAQPSTLPEGTLSLQLARDRHPDWLQPVPLENTPLRLYRVVR